MRFNVNASFVIAQRRWDSWFQTFLIFCKKRVPIRKPGFTQSSLLWQFLILALNKYERITTVFSFSLNTDTIPVHNLLKLLVVHPTGIVFISKATTSLRFHKTRSTLHVVRNTIKSRAWISCVSWCATQLVILLITLWMGVPWALVLYNWRFCW